MLPAAAAWCESEGTVTSSERRVQRVRKALNPPGDARDDISILSDLAKQLGRDWGTPSAEDVWNEIRRLSPWHGGMSYQRLEALDGLQWPCPTDDHPGSPLLHDRLWRNPIDGPPAPFIPVVFEPPVDVLSPDFPMRLTTGRRLDSFNTGVQTGGYSSPLRFGETIDLAPEDGVSLGVAEGERVRIVSRRGAVDAPVRFDRGLRPGLVHDDALSRRSRHQPADHRRDRPQVGHRGVQGVGRSYRETLSGPSPDPRCGRDARRTRSDRRGAEHPGLRRQSSRAGFGLARRSAGGA